MNGHEPIRTLRQQGFKPAYVWLQDSGILRTDHAVTLTPSDIPESLDLRFLVGTTVILESASKDRLTRLSQACVDARARRVIASLHAGAAGRFEITEVTDTEGDMTWPK